MREYAGICLAITALIIAADVRGQACEPIRMTSSEQSRAMSAAQRVAELPVKRKTLDSCGVGDLRVANFETESAREADGSDRWYTVSCTRQLNKVSGWKCEASLERSISFAEPSGAFQVRLGIPEELDVSTARELSTRGYLQAASLGPENACHSAQYPEASFKYFREAFFGRESGDMLLDHEAGYLSSGGGLVLARGGYFVTLKSEVKGFSSSRAPCWDFIDYLE